MVPAAGEAEQEGVERGRVRRGSRGGDGDELKREERVGLRGHQLVQPRRRDRRRRGEHRRVVVWRLGLQSRRETDLGFGLLFFGKV